MLVAFAMTGHASKDITVYVKADVAPNLYVWQNESDLLNGSWPGTQMSGEKVTVRGMEFWAKTFTIGDNETLKVILNNGSQQTTDMTNVSRDMYLEYDGTTSATEPFYYVFAGAEGLLGSDWNLNDPANFLTKSGNVWTLEKTGVELAKGTYAYKYVKSYSSQWAGGDDKTVDVPSDGIYTITMTVDPTNESAYSLTVLKTGDVVLPDAEITRVQLLGDWNWTTGEGKNLTLVKGEGNTWTGTLDLSTTIAEQKFKLTINDDIWLGNNEVSITAPEGWVAPESALDKANYLLKNATTGYKTYTVSASWEPSSNAGTGWTVTIAGKDARPMHTASFVNGKAWTKVYAYAWQGDGEDAVKLNGTYPGVELTKSGTTTIDEKEYDVYTYTLASNTTNAPEKIIFSDGTEENKTADLPFEQDKQYTVTLPTMYKAYFTNSKGWETVSVYTWNGNGESAVALEGAWPGKDITASKDGDTYTYKYWGWSAPEYIIFNNGKASDAADKEQTTDAAFVNGKTYTFVTSQTIEISKEFATYSNADYALDFTESTIKAYKATVSDGKVLLTKVNKVPAGVGVLLQANGKTSEEIPTATDVASLDGNLFVATDGTTDITASAEGSYNYVLQTNDDVQGFYNVTSTITAPAAGKAYLHTTTALASEAKAREAWIFAGGETTGINTVREAVNDNRYYNLAGQRVSQPGRGLYIVNGKKVVIK